MRSSSSNKHISSSGAAPSSSYSLLQPLVPEVKELSSGYTRLSANPMVGESCRRRNSPLPLPRPTTLTPTIPPAARCLAVSSPSRY